MKKPFLPLALFLMLQACSVKEDRGPCPCLMSIITAEAFAPVAEDPDTEWKLTLTGFAEEGKIVEECFSPERVQDTLELPVKKGELVVTAWLTETDTPVLDGRWIIPAGEQAHAFFACRDTVDASGETVCCRLQPHKHYSTITLMDAGGTGEPFSGRTLIVRGRSCGLDLATMQPVEGTFECLAAASETLSGRGFQVRIPRQEAPSLELELIPEEAGIATSRLTLGDVLFAQPFTPADEDLPDYIVWLSTTGPSATVSSVITVRPWK